jgi:hypothetical protein
MMHENTPAADVLPAPLWAERLLHPHSPVRDAPALLVVRLPGEAVWQVASSLEADAIADPTSLVGGSLRAHCGLLSLPHFSAN